MISEMCNVLIFERPAFIIEKKYIYRKKANQDLTMTFSMIQGCQVG